MKNRLFVINPLKRKFEPFSCESLPYRNIHSDPFDLLLIAQAQIEKLSLVTRDEHIKKYAIPFITV